MRSDEYFDKYRFESKPTLLKKIAYEMMQLIPPCTDVLAGLEMGGIVSNDSRMQYTTNRDKNLPIGSGVIESAIRRVINMRVKSPGSFWKLHFADTMIYLRAQLLYGRWENLKNN